MGLPALSAAGSVRSDAVKRPRRAPRGGGAVAPQVADRKSGNAGSVCHSEAELIESFVGLCAAARAHGGTARADRGALRPILRFCREFLGIWRGTDPDGARASTASRIYSPHFPTVCASS